MIKLGYKFGFDMTKFIDHLLIRGLIHLYNILFLILFLTTLHVHHIVCFFCILFLWSYNIYLDLSHLH